MPSAEKQNHERARRPAGSGSSRADAALVARVDETLAGWLDQRQLPENLRRAIRYAALAPGKRMRPLLMLRSAEAVGGKAEDAMAAAAAIELIHAFSLVHDDLPAMDDDDLRRGRPTLHRHAGEAMAVLAGDAMLGLSIELVVERLSPPELARDVCRELIRGCNDMIAGQVYDTVPDSDTFETPLERLTNIHRHKTGALIRAACRCGAMCGGAGSTELAAITRFGEKIGLMFQVVDDLLDVTQTTEHLGKTAGKDAEQQKLTYPAVLGLEETQRETRRLREEALSAIDDIGRNAVPLRELCEFLAVRTR